MLNILFHKANRKNTLPKIHPSFINNHDKLKKIIKKKVLINKHSYS